MGEVLERAFTEQRLLDAWAGVRDAALADGESGPEIDRFEDAAARHISELAKALGDGSFQQHPVIRVEIAKPDAGVRRLAVPLLVDRIVERALPAELDPVIDRFSCRGASPTGAGWESPMPSRALRGHATTARAG